MTTPSITEAQICETAYRFWQEDGQPNGRDQEHWLKAVDALTLAQAQEKSARKAPAKRTAAKTASKPVEAKAKSPAAVKKPRATKAAAKSTAKAKTA